MEALQSKARELLEKQAVQVVVGYEKGSGNLVRAAFITQPEHASRLIYDERCIQNLAVYLTKSEVRKLGKAAIVANVSTIRSINILLSENQLKADQLVVLMVTEDKQLKIFSDFHESDAYLQSIQPGLTAKDRDALEKLKKMSQQERWEYWQVELSRCFRCHACRAACPMCYCKRCITDCNQPGWIPVSSNLRGNFDWHVNRAMHLAGRCVGCGDCGRACPVDIPIHLLTIFASDEAFEMFGHVAGAAHVQNSALSTFKPDDKENFIL